MIRSFSRVGKEISEKAGLSGARKKGSRQSRFFFVSFAEWLVRPSGLPDDSLIEIHSAREGVQTDVLIDSVDA